MLKLIESNIVDVRLKLSNVNINWLEECKNKVDEKEEWAKSTKTVRKTCLNSFYKFVKETFDKTQIPYQRHLKIMKLSFFSLPKEDEEKYASLDKTVLKHALSNVPEKIKAIDLCPQILCNCLK